MELEDGSFGCGHPDAPDMDLEALRYHVELMDKRAYFDLLHSLAPEDRGKKENILEYLKEYEPVLYLALASILEAYQNSYFVATQTKSAIIKNYIRYRVAVATMRDEGRNMVAEVEEQVKKKRPAKQKRAREKPTVEEIEQEMEQVEAVAKDLRLHTSDDYYSQEKFSADFPLKEFMHFVSKGKQKWSMEEFTRNGPWETIYHVNGQWQAENLQQKLKKSGVKCAILKRIKAKTDMEVFSYKVIAAASS